MAAWFIGIFIGLVVGFVACWIWKNRVQKKIQSDVAALKAAAAKASTTKGISKL